jgi:hypothetical protein
MALPCVSVVPAAALAVPPAGWERQHSQERREIGDDAADLVQE